MFRSQSPANTSLPAVVSAAVLIGEGVRWRHLISPLGTSMARSSPRSPSESGCSVLMRRTGPVPPPPPPRTWSTGPNVASSQLSVMGTYRARVWGLYAIARQLLKPEVLGHMSISTPSSGIMPGR